MQYALITDLHSSLSDTRAVLTAIQQIAPQAIVFSLGDVHECHIGKKRAKRYAFEETEQIVTLDPDFLKLLFFETLLGNQEERLLSLIPIKASSTLDQLRSSDRLKQMESALFLHGDQLKWSYDLTPDTSHYKERLLFFGHSHVRGLFKDGKRLRIQLGVPISIKRGYYAINVGPVLVEREWLLYDTTAETITFHQTR
ncbi:metallophosphatase family protein [Exiguobacterium sp. KRL4]|uniref:metallophosphoesterase family protein n=1 Tax=Exiguobacterium sp. KRL4 TaxID=1914536 RepID=UPI0008F7F99E|nr:metallophosphoesterase family protein [Exiguobacterium sp. KRL4]OIN67509.1 metallophosphatase family protein [Exiguobacterium sp. KRL4]